MRDADSPNVLAERTGPHLGFETTLDAFLSGDVMLVQPASGAHRSGSDAVFLAACLTGVEGHVLDMGAGAGAVGLMVAQCAPQARVTMAENDQQLLACCAASLDLAGCPRAHLIAVDLLASEAQRVDAGLKRAYFDHIVSNPPYRKAGHVRANPAKQAAHVVDQATLDGWMRTAASVVKPGGTLTLIFAADGLLDVLAAFKGRFGAVQILGLHPRAGAPAERLLIRAIKGRKTAPMLLPGLVLHNDDGSYTQAARAILEGERAIAFAG